MLTESGQYPLVFSFIDMIYNLVFISVTICWLVFRIVIYNQHITIQVDGNRF